MAGLRKDRKGTFSEVASKLTRSKDMTKDFRTS